MHRREGGDDALLLRADPVDRGQGKPEQDRDDGVAFHDKQ